MVGVALLLTQPPSTELLSRVLPCLDAPQSNEESAAVVRYLDNWNTITGNWFHIADYLLQLDRLHSNEKFPEHERAAIVASKVYFFLNEYGESLKYALKATSLFSLTPKACDDSIGPQDEMFVNKIIEVALDTYKAIQRNCNKIELDMKSMCALNAMVDRIFDDTISAGDFRSALALAFDAVRHDRIDEAITKALAKGDEGILYDALMHALLTMNVAQATDRDDALDLVLRKYEELKEPDFVRMCQAMIKLNRPIAVAKLLSKLGEKSGCHELYAYQIAFDLYESASQQFIRACIRELWSHDVGVETTSQYDMLDTTQRESNEDVNLTQEKSDEKSVTISNDEIDNPIVANLINILLGKETVKLNMQFLIKNNKNDPQVLKQIKDSVRSNVPHNATCLAHGIMQCGTTCDDFLRDNLEWVSKATNWNKFNAVASLGNIHYAHETQAMTVLRSYLPTNTNAGESSGYKEGGALYALGLIFANHGSTETIDYLCEQLQLANSAPLKHGASLGLGLAAMGTHDKRVYLKLRDILYTDDAVASMGSAYAMGLVYAGGFRTDAQEVEVYTEMYQYMCETQHGRIKEGLRVGIALLFYGIGAQADQYIDTLLANSASVADRQTAVLAIAMAYAGTSDAAQVHKLLTRVAADPNHDLKRTAALAIGFIMLRNPDGCLNYAKLMAEHFNGYVRYGATMAVGIACSATGNKDAIALIEPLLNDKDSYVRQGAALALAMIMIQQNDVLCPRQQAFRDKLFKMMNEKGEDQIVKFGAILATGILDAGGRNLTISMVSHATHDADMRSVIGMLLFMQHFTWFSMVPTIALTFKPTALIGLNKNLKMPVIQYRCNAKPSQFAYVPAIEVDKQKDQVKVETAVLSFTNRLTKKKQLVIDQKKENVKEPKTPTPTPADSAKPGASASASPRPASPMQVDEQVKTTTSEEEKKDDKKPEPLTHVLHNPARVMPAQLKLMSIDKDDQASVRYTPIKPLMRGGIVILNDAAPETEEKLVQWTQAGGVPTTTNVNGAERKIPPPNFTISTSKYLSKN